MAIIKMAMIIPLQASGLYLHVYIRKYVYIHVYTHRAVDPSLSHRDLQAVTDINPGGTAGCS